MDIKKQIKLALANRDMNMTQLALELNKKYNRSSNAQVLTKKLKNNTIRYIEVAEIFDILGYGISFNELDNWGSSLKTRCSP